MDRDVEERFKRIEEYAEQTRRDLAEAAGVVKFLVSQQAESEQRQKRIEHHLEVLVDSTDGLIRDRRFRELEERIRALESRH